RSVTASRNTMQKPQSAKDQVGAVGCRSTLAVIDSQHAAVDERIPLQCLIDGLSYACTVSVVKQQISIAVQKRQHSVNVLRHKIRLMHRINQDKIEGLTGARSRLCKDVRRAAGDERGPTGKHSPVRRFDLEVRVDSDKL